MAEQIGSRSLARYVAGSVQAHADGLNARGGVTAARVAAGQLRVTFTPGADNGSTTTGYTATCASTNGGASGAATGSASPLTVSGLTAGKSYSCIVTAKNARGTSPRSNASSAVTA